MHLAPETHVTAKCFIPVITARAIDPIALSDGLAEQRRHHAAYIQDWEAATTAVLVGCITLHAGKTPKGTATSAHITEAITEASAPLPMV